LFPHHREYLRRWGLELSTSLAHQDLVRGDIRSESFLAGLNHGVEEDDIPQWETEHGGQRSDRDRSAAAVMHELLAG